MKTCEHCRHAVWKRTAAGKLHPSGEGQCKFEYKLPPLPASMYWLGMNPPKPFRSQINRRETNTDHCPYYDREAK